MLLSLLCLGLPAYTENASIPTTETRWKTREHPFLFADQAMLLKSRERVETFPWAKAIYTGLIKKADKILSEAIDIPAVGGQWSHHYVCQECGARLSHKEGKHLCPSCGKEYRGWPYDEVIAGNRHRKNLNNIETLGLAYAFSENEAYARYARDILLQYAEVYTSYPLHDYRGGTLKKGARLLAQTLGESTSIIGAAWGYDLIYSSSSIKDSEREKIEERFFREVAKTIARNDMGISNWQSWHNAALSSIGYCIQDETMVSNAIDGKSGFKFQMKNSVLKDGFWYEGSPAYHFYSLDALRWTALGARMAGNDLVPIPEFQAMFQAPTRYLFPDFSFPAVNDSGSFSISRFSGLYELAYSWYGDPVYSMAAQRGGRKNVAALLWGAETLPADPGELSFEPVRDSPGVGGAILTQGGGQTPALSFHIHYGPHGGYHGHPDKLALIVFARGEVIVADPARVAYASPLQEGWYKTTLAHNTLVVDCKNQAPAEARSIRFQESNRFCAVQAECPTAYPGVDLIRTTALTPHYLLDVFIARSQTAHLFDLPFHIDGELREPPPMEPCDPLGNKAGYQHLKEISKSPTGQNWSADFYQSANRGVRFSLLGHTPSAVYLSSGRVGSPPRRIPMLLLRQSGKTACFLSLMEPFDGAPSILKVETEQVEKAGKQWIRFSIDRKGRRERLDLLEPELPLDSSQAFITLQ